MTHPTDLRYAGQPINRSEPMPEIGMPIRRGETVTHIDPLGNVVPGPGEQPSAGGYTVAPGLAAQAAREAEGPKPQVSDVIAQDAAPLEYPDGCPQFRPLHRLGFLEKAEAFELYDVVQTAVSEVTATAKKGESLEGKRAAAYYRVLAKIDEFLAYVAIDSAAYEIWDGRTDEQTFIKAWNAYQGGAQPGEAASSSS